jgi:hypothetical protein
MYRIARKGGVPAEALELGVVLAPEEAAVEADAAAAREGALEQVRAPAEVEVVRERARVPEALGPAELGVQALGAEVHQREQGQ